VRLRGIYIKKAVCIIMVYAIACSVLLTACSQKTKTEIRAKVDVAIFNGDYTVISNTDNYNIISYSIKDFKKIKTKNVWVTNWFLKNKERIDSIKELLENDYNILIQKYEFTSSNAYSLFGIPKEKQATKISSEAELKDVKPPLERYGVMIIKYKGLYYTIGINSIQSGNIESLLNAFDYNKELLLG